MKNTLKIADGMGNNWSDFTVGAVLLKSGMGNYFNGLIGGLAVFKGELRRKKLNCYATKNKITRSRTPGYLIRKMFL